MPYRKVLMPFFSPKAVKAMDEQIEFPRQPHRRCGQGQGRCEFVRDVAAPFPVTVFMILMGLPLERFEDFRQMVDDFFNAQGTERLEGITAAMNAEIMAIINARRAEPKEDLVSHLVNADMDGRKLTEYELLNMCFLLVLGGLDTVTNMLTFTTHRLAQEPEVQEAPDRRPLADRRRDGGGAAPVRRRQCAARREEGCRPAGRAVPCRRHGAVHAANGRMGRY